MKLLRAPAFALGALALMASPALAAGPNDLLPEAPAKAVVVRACTTCHQASQVVAKRHTAQEWEMLIGKMLSLGARLSDDEAEQVYDYLVKNFGPAPTAAAQKAGK
jgi:hypothetical protein